MRVRSQLVRRVAATAAGLGLAAGAVVGIVGATAANAETKSTTVTASTAAVKKTVTIDGSDWIVPAGSKVRYFGKTTGIAKNTKVQVQRLEGKKWVNFPATTKVTSKGTYSVYVQTSRVGKHQFRVAVAGLVTKQQHLEITKK
ncbi:hypothetical protein GCM10029976_078070 [Kribbella albertanoniae]|uniref:Uncharacterized protein n=1 Tax=Kribbella albertanoniae TaxID=1266829 RepID=A0A4R4P9C5_9ACTN|nr:hypothetical protein [Kribbella albertanoniae]TDC17477.1 hypothetical protein E1261_37020 [Kribbella albertanoniae]